jgi:hypothetical protein
MAGSYGDYWEQEILDHIFGLGVYTPQTIYVGLSTADPLDDGSGIAEPVGGSYARVSFATWVRAGSQISNNAVIDFGEATGSWGALTHFFAIDTASGAGDLMFHGDLTTPKTIESGDEAKFKAGQLTCSQT